MEDVVFHQLGIAKPIFYVLVSSSHMNENITYYISLINSIIKNDYYLNLKNQKLKTITITIQLN